MRDASFLVPLLSLPDSGKSPLSGGTGDRFGGRTSVRKPSADSAQDGLNE